ncbi:hypothetical protein PTTG_26150 [Puccinia triticina 1-1 BBBD Race 1]|uniref:Uncharacterized protein n=2 Tax=Puccinia triticina TaxID=208348 RepID=A0A180GWJ6_PUCT1|nr:uncharacterized protein PtA15_6A768 [Puccinia triticina]OAV97130.1 hypothetical protein PTTG_26150 [Puccinia triticina 1-1 BBBD Race 1]WAQ86138.1 hypothetical protein PtA15_6A768 [Puccinia triticina]WAR56024.1 hypothetical protein PtB15_6B768 [Puccinia triticina]
MATLVTVSVTASTCEPPNPKGYCVTRGIHKKKGQGPGQLKLMLPANVVNGAGGLSMNCDKIKSDSMWCCPTEDFRWVDEKQTLTDSDIEGICQQLTPKTDEAGEGSDGQ